VIARLHDDVIRDVLCHWMGHRQSGFNLKLTEMIKGVEHRPPESGARPHAAPRHPNSRAGSPTASHPDQPPPGIGDPVLFVRAGDIAPLVFFPFRSSLFPFGWSAEVRRFPGKFEV